MMPLKGKSVHGPTKNETGTMSKFKVYSENSKVNGPRRGNTDTRPCPSRTSTLLKKDSLLSSKSTLKGKDLLTGSAETGVLDDPLGKTKVRRQALADVSNVRQNPFRVEKPGSFRNSITSAAVRSTALSNRPPVRKVRASATSVTASSSSVKFSTRSMSTSSNSGRVEAVQTVHNMTRNSFPVMKKLMQLSSSDLQSQGDIRKAEKSTRKIGFPVNRRVGGVGHLKTKVTKDRASDGFMDITHRNKTSTGALQGSRISVKPSSRTTLQTFMAHRNSKSKSINSLDKSLVTSGRRVKLITSGTKTSKSIVTQEDVTEGASSGEHGDNMKPEMLKTTSSKKSNRRKSYTSSLISGSKYIKAEKEEKLPDIDDKGNPLEVAEYVDDIYQYYWITEAQSTSLENYMVIQTDITPQMRSILVNWLVEVSDLISISAESYTRKQILEMEKDILRKLKFRLNLPTAYVFMLRFLKASKSGKKLEHLAFYLIELCLIDYEALKFRPSLLCASAVYVARCTLNKSPAWTSLLGKHAHCDELQIRECSQKILTVHKAASSSQLTVTRDKYNRPEFGRVATIQPLVCLPR